MHKRISVFKKNFTVILLFFYQAVVLGQPGSLDSTFNGTGRVFITSKDVYGTILGNLNAIQPDGKLLVVGVERGFLGTDTKCHIIRYNENGIPDSSFGNAGIVAGDFGRKNATCGSIAVQNDGKIIAGGKFYNDSVNNNYTTAIRARYNANGVIDSSFGINGEVIADFNPGIEGYYSIGPIKILKNGKILIGSNGIVARLNSNGFLDSTYGINGIVTGNLGNFDQDDRKKIIRTGTRNIAGVDHFEVTRYHPNGQLDLSFNEVGYVNTYIDSLGAKPYAAIVQQDEKIIVAGTVIKEHLSAPNRYYNSSDFVIVRYHENGTIDSSFGTNGIVITDMGYGQYDYPSEIALQSDGKILVSGNVGAIAGESQSYALARYLQNGNLDNSFADSGRKLYDPLGKCFGMKLKNNRIYLSGFAFYNNLNPVITGINIFAIKNDGIPLSPVSLDLCTGIANTNFSSDLPGTSYQWQLSTDSVVFSDLSNNSTYSGVNTSNLAINHIPSSWYGYQFRCVVDNGVSNLFTVRISNVWTGSVSTAWENPANWSCGSLPDAFTDVVINSGTVIINSNVTVRSLTIGAGAALTVGTGYNLTVLH